jgi:16S rRNA (guanine527-N7)-methyltransferase
MDTLSDDYLITSFNISREIIETLRNYQKLVLTWNSKFNLISKNSIENFWVRHIIDSLQLLKFISDKDIILVDIGSGAGFPGIVLSIAGVKTVTLIESNAKKAAFLLQAARLSGNKVEVNNRRIENERLSCDILTTRAFGDLSAIFEYTKNIQVKDKYLLLKSGNYEQEFEIARKNWLFDYKIHKSITLNESKILEISNLA